MRLKRSTTSMLEQGGCYLSPYIADMGFVVKNIPTNFSFLVEHYGLIKADCVILPESKRQFYDQGFKLSYKKGPLSNGDALEVNLLLKASKEKYNQMDTVLQQILHLVVSIKTYYFTVANIYRII